MSTEINKVIEREDVRTRIIEGASTLFFRNGIKSVKMDDIAHELNVSKRTIYEHFTDKEQLLIECLKFIYQELRAQGKKLIRKSSRNTLDVILILYKIYFDMLKRANRNFFIDVKKYPQIIKHQQRREESNNRKFKAWMQQGIDEGLFREDAKSDILLYILKRDLELIIETTDFNTYSTDDLGKNFILFYLRCIATPKGQQIIEEFIQKSEPNNTNT